MAFTVNIAVGIEPSEVICEFLTKRRPLYLANPTLVENGQTKNFQQKGRKKSAAPYRRQPKIPLKLKAQSQRIQRLISAKFVGVR